MPTATKARKAPKSTSAQRTGPAVVSLGCPAGVGPEIALAAAAHFRKGPVVLVGSKLLVERAAKVTRVSIDKLQSYPAAGPLRTRGLYLLETGPKVAVADCRPGHPTKNSGAAQLAYVNQAFELVRRTPRAFLATAPVNKLAIAKCGVTGADKFRGHTEWLQALDGSRQSVMCFWSEALTTTLVTTHLPISAVPAAITASGVASATRALAELLRRLGKRRPTVAVASLNPHAGEGELLGHEERTKIAPGADLARTELGRRAKIIGPIGAETAYRKASAGQYDGVVAMYHDQATIPLKLLAFGNAVNVTLGLSIVRTSVDHGTAYDIAWQGKADYRGMLAALELGARLAS